MLRLVNNLATFSDFEPVHLNETGRRDFTAWITDRLLTAATVTASIEPLPASASQD